MCAIMQEYEKKAEARGEVRVMTKTAINMLKKGLSFDIVADCTGLSFEQVMALKQRAAAELSESFA